ncbi:hypothetical protein [Stenotrophomonas sp. PS02298]|nr:hypothetical protein [Stenotrophomonas sp. PS02298]
MKRFVNGVDRSQALLLSDWREDYVHEDNPVRVVDTLKPLTVAFALVTS